MCLAQLPEEALQEAVQCPHSRAQTSRRPQTLRVCCLVSHGAAPRVHRPTNASSEPGAICIRRRGAETLQLTDQDFLLQVLVRLEIGPTGGADAAPAPSHSQGKTTATCTNGPVAACRAWLCPATRASNGPYRHSSNRTSLFGGFGFESRPKSARAGCKRMVPKHSVSIGIDTKIRFSDLHASEFMFLGGNLTHICL